MVAVVITEWGAQELDGRRAPSFCLNPNRRVVDPIAFPCPPTNTILRPLALDLTVLEGHTYNGKLKINASKCSWASCPQDPLISVYTGLSVTLNIYFVMESVGSWEILLSISCPESSKPKAAVWLPSLRERQCAAGWGRV